MTFQATWRDGASKSVSRYVSLLSGFAALARAGVALARLRGGRPLIDEARVAEMRQTGWLADGDRLTAATGWAPGTSLEDGLAATLRWYRDNGWL